MNPFSRILTALLPASALLVGGAFVPTYSAQPAPVTPRVSFVNVDKECSTYTADGQRQKQCRVHFTASASQVRKGYRISVVTVYPNAGFKTTIGAFVARRSTARMRFHGAGNGEVCSYGSAGSMSHVRFHAVVKDQDGRRLLTTRPTRLC